MRCKNLFIGCVACLLLLPGFGSAAETPAETPAKAPQAFLPERVYGFQPVLEGTEVVHEFILENRGEAPLNILQIKSG